MIEKTRSSLSKATAPVLGVPLFLDKILQTPHQQAAKNMVYEGLNLAQYGPQKSIIKLFYVQRCQFWQSIRKSQARKRY